MSERAMQFRIGNTGPETLNVFAMKANGESWPLFERVKPGYKILVTAYGPKPNGEDQLEFDFDDDGLTLWTWSECQGISAERDN